MLFYGRHKNQRPCTRRSEDWEIAYQQVFPCSHVLDKETQSHFKDGFMEGYKFKKTE